MHQGHGERGDVSKVVAVPLVKRAGQSWIIYRIEFCLKPRWLKSVAFSTVVASWLWIG
jgi:hypothetical protein